MNQRRTISYILRLWTDQDDDDIEAEALIWHAQLVHPDTGERVGFASLDELLAYLQEEITQVVRHH